MNITCTNCKRIYNGQAHLHQRPGPALGADVIEYYLQCPICDQQTHTHYVNREITRLQRLVQIRLTRLQQKPTPENEAAWRKVIANLKPVFDELNLPKQMEAQRV